MNANDRKRLVWMALNGMGHDADKVSKATKDLLVKMLGQAMQAHKRERLDVFAKVRLASAIVLADAKRLGL